MVDTIDQVKKLLTSSPKFGGEVASEVVSYLAQVANRPDHVDKLSGSPAIAEIEAVRQSFAGSFHRRMFEELTMLNAAAMRELLPRVEDIRGYLRRLRATSTVIAVKHGNAFVYPAFQFDDRGSVKRVVARVNDVLRASEDPWGALAWWTAANPRWERRRPIDHIDDDDELVSLVLAEAADEY